MVDLFKKIISVDQWTDILKIFLGQNNTNSYIFFQKKQPQMQPKRPSIRQKPHFSQHLLKKHDFIGIFHINPPQEHSSHQKSLFLGKQQKIGYLQYYIAGQQRIQYRKLAHMHSDNIHYHTQHPQPLLVAQTNGIKTAGNSAPRHFYEPRQVSHYVSNSPQLKNPHELQSSNISPKRIPQVKIPDTTVFSEFHPSVIGKSRRHDLYTQNGSERQSTRRQVRKEEEPPKTSSNCKKCAIFMLVLLLVLLFTLAVLFGLWKFGIFQNGQNFGSGGTPTVALGQKKVAAKAAPNNLTVLSALPKATNSANTNTANLTAQAAAPVNTTNTLQPIIAAPVVAPVIKTNINPINSTTTATTIIPITNPKTATKVPIVAPTTTNVTKANPIVASTKTKVSPIVAPTTTNVTKANPIVASTKTKVSPIVAPTTTKNVTKVSPIVAPTSAITTLPTTNVTKIPPAPAQTINNATTPPASNLTTTGKVA